MVLPQLKKGDKVKVTHARKGTFNAQLNQDIPTDDVFISLTVIDHPVEGLVNSWEVGEELSVRASLITNIKKID